MRRDGPYTPPRSRERSRFQQGFEVLGAVRSLLIAGLLLLGTVPAGAMTVTVEQRVPRVAAPSQRPATVTTVRMTGMIERGDAETLRKTLDRLKASTAVSADGTLATVELSSSGGDVFEGVAIGYLFREFAVGTLVRSSDVCFSACALAFLGGSAALPGGIGPWRNLELGGQVGFHNMWLNHHGLRNSAHEASNAAIAGFDVARAGASLIVRYTFDMGIEATFAARLLGRPTEQFEYIAAAGTFVELQTCLTQPVAVLASLEQQADNICSNAIGSAARGGSGNVRTVTAYDVRVALLRELERQGASSAASSRFADRFRGVIAGREERAITDLYDGLQAAGLPLPDLSGTIYDVTPAPASLRMSCKVSLPARDLDSYDLAVVGPKGVSAPAHVTPERCRWMMRHGPADMINPARRAGGGPTLAMPPAAPPDSKHPPRSE
jgi:hypothetical protein